MSRRKQSRPLKRLIVEEEEEDETPVSNTKAIKIDEPSTSGTAMTAKTVPKQPLPPLLLLENSVKKFDPGRSSLPSNGIHDGKSMKLLGEIDLQRRAQQKPATGLGALYNFVGKLTSSPVTGNLSEDGVSSVLKCLQCGKGFAAMDQLVRHMQETKHFSNLPKSYSNFVQMERQKVLNMKLQSKSETFQLACIKCGEVPGNMDKHLREVHDIKGNTEWLKHVQIVPGGTVKSTPTQLNQLMSLINTVAKK